MTFNKFKRVELFSADHLYAGCITFFLSHSVKKISQVIIESFRFLLNFPRPKPILELSENTTRRYGPYLCCFSLGIYPSCYSAVDKLVLDC